MLEFENRKNLDAQFISLKKTLNGEITEKENVFFEILKSELEGYFAGKLKKFSVPLHLTGTEFQKKVWNELLNIPYGETISYLELAVNIGNSKAVRAVANANALNKIAVIIPCHRVIGSDGTLTGYAAGLDKKRRLLEIENCGQDLFTSI